MKDLGLANYWGNEYPPEYRQYLELVNKGEIPIAKEIVLNSCLREYICPELRIKWKVDSSD